MRTRWYLPSRPFSGNNMNILFLSGSLPLTSDKGSIFSVACEFDSMPFLGVSPLLRLSFTWFSITGDTSHQSPCRIKHCYKHTSIHVPSRSSKTMWEILGAASPPYLLVHGFPFIPTFLASSILRGESSYVVSNSCYELYSVRK